MSFPLLTHLLAPAHTHRSLDAGVVDQRLAHLRDHTKDAPLAHLRGLEALSRISHALEPLTHRGDAMFGTLRRRGEPSDFGLCTPLYAASAKAGLASQPVIIRVCQPYAMVVSHTLPPRMLSALNPDMRQARAATAALFSAWVGTLPGQLFGMGVMPICWTSSQTWAATKLAILGSGYLAGFALGQAEHTLSRVWGAAAQKAITPCNTLTFALQTPIAEVTPASLFVTGDGRHAFDVEELAEWFKANRHRRNVYTNMPFDAADDKRLAKYGIAGVQDPLYDASMLTQWEHFALRDRLLLMACAATLVVAKEGAFVEAAIEQIEAIVRRSTPAERGALDALLAGPDGAPLAERLLLCRGTERARRMAGAEFYAALRAPIELEMWRLVWPSYKGKPDSARYLAGLIARHVMVDICLLQMDSDAAAPTLLPLPSAEFVALLAQKNLWVHRATIEA